MDVLPMETIAAAVRSAGQKFGLTLAVLFGSVAKGKAAARSDIDLAVKGARPLALRDLLRIEGDVSDALGGRIVSVQDIRTASPALLKEILLSETAGLLYGSTEEFARERVRALHEYEDTAPLRRRTVEYIHVALRRMAVAR